MEKEAVDGLGGGGDDLELAASSLRVHVAELQELGRDKWIRVAAFGEDQGLLRGKKRAGAGEHLGFEAFGVDLEGDDFARRDGKAANGQEIIETRNGSLEAMDEE
jgi:hypothetical protein